jgi:hypothetical protein
MLICSTSEVNKAGKGVIVEALRNGQVARIDHLFDDPASG